MNSFKDMHAKTLDLESLCRTCMSTRSKVNENNASKPKRCIYEKSTDSDEGPTIMELLQSVQPDIQVHAKDKLPKIMCHECIEQLQKTHEFLQLCKDTDDKFRKMLKEVDTTDDEQLSKEAGQKFDGEYINEDGSNNPILKLEIDMDEDEDQRPEFEAMFINNKAGEEIGDDNDDAIDLSDNPFDNVNDEDNDEWTLTKKPGKRKAFKPSERKGRNNKTTKSTKCKVSKPSKNKQTVISLISQQPPLPNEDGSITCQECEKILANVTLWQDHMQAHNSAKVRVKRTRNVNPKRFECEYCGKVFQRRSVYNTHVLIHTGNFRCLECGKKCKSYDDLNLHMLCHKGERFECDKCGKEFPTTDEYNDHMLTHKGDQPLRCLECEKTFKSALGLRTHMLRHKGEKNFHCPHCPRKFVVRSGLYGHVKQQHEEGTPHLCDICGKGFRLADTLNKHKRYHNDRNFACEYCDKRFITSEKQRRHMRIHTGEKPYRCKYCDRAYSQSSECNKHMKQHLGENIFQCELCPLRFPLVRDVRAHFASHKDEDEETRARNLEARALEEKILKIKFGIS